LVDRDDPRLLALLALAAGSAQASALSPAAINNRPQSR
jgi:hypothetical protein